MLVIDANRQVLGRLAAKAAKEALNGEEIVVVNAEKAYVSGNPENILKENHDKAQIKNKGNFNKGPYHPKRPDTYVRKSIRGMLPWKRQRGRDAYKRIKVYIGTPSVLFDKMNVPKPKEEDQIQIKKLRRKLTVGQICESLGGKW